MNNDKSFPVGEESVLDVSGVLGTESASLDFDRRFSCDLSGAVESPGEIRISGSVVNSAGYAQFKATVRVTYKTLCARCLKSLDRLLEAEILYPVAESLENEDNDEYLIPSAGRLDLAQLARDAFFLNLPMSELCSPDCRGLCQTCGKNLNEGDCSCPKTRIDPRLSKLKDFFKE